jgi:hypothetical protein
MASVTKPRRRTAKPRGPRKSSRSRVAVEFAPGSLEAKLSAIGKSVPARKWATVPADYFANVDHYRHPELTGQVRGRRARRPSSG